MPGGKLLIYSVFNVQKGQKFSLPHFLKSYTILNLLASGTNHQRKSEIEEKGSYTNLTG